MTVGQIMEEVKAIGEKYRVGGLILFGSFAKGTATARSDIDLAIYGAVRFDEIKEEIKNIPTLRSFDVINMDTCANEYLIEEIRSYGKKIL